MMVSNELAKNTKSNLMDTLRYLSDESEIRKYEAKVPFVHVPNEIACQWEQHSLLLNRQRWFQNMFNEAQLNELRHFDRSMKSFLSLFKRDLPEVNELVQHSQWPAILNAAAKLRAVLEEDSTHN